MHRPPQKIYFPGSKVPRIIGHRGNSFYFPENTVPSFNSAFACPADGIETDLQLTRDGVPVIFHNRTLLTLDKSRSHILNRSLAELKKLDWRGIHNKKQYSKPLRVVTFTDFLKRYCHFVKEPLKKCICLELKSRKHDRETGMQEKLARAVISALRNSKVDIKAGYVKILSFDFDLLMFVHRICKEIPLVYNLSAQKDFSRIFRSEKSIKTSTDKHHNSFLKKLEAVCIDINSVTVGFVKKVHSSGRYVMSYACNTHAQLRKAETCGVDTVMSDRPLWAVEGIRWR